MYKRSIEIAMRAQKHVFKYTINHTFVYVVFVEFEIYRFESSDGGGGNGDSGSSSKFIM